MAFGWTEATGPGFRWESGWTSRRRPPYSCSSFSRRGPSILHGPHQGAQKSTMVGTSSEASITSRSKEDSVVSIMVFPSLIDRCGDRHGRSGSDAVNEVRHAIEKPQDSSYLADNRGNPPSQAPPH